MASTVKHRIVRKKGAVGLERRYQNIGKILEGNLSFPKPVEYEDLDKEFKKWVEEKLSIQFDGEELPTYNLYSNQRIGEYTQSWNYLDEKTGNFRMNFKTITRDNNPKPGTIYGERANIPGNRDYVLGYKEASQENGTTGYDVYTMKQPFSVDLEYKVSVVTNKYELLNNFNQLVINAFKSKQDYIRPNGHYMSMVLGDISDESEYNISDRKFYSQTYNITLRAYIIRKEDLQVTHLPNRFNIYVNKGNNNTKFKHQVETILTESTTKTIIIDCSYNDNEVSFNYDENGNVSIENIELMNIDSLNSIAINGEIIDDIEEQGLLITNGDKITLVYTKDYNKSPNTITLSGTIE